MHGVKFNDAEDREWTIFIDAPMLQKVREEHDVDFQDLSRESQWKRLHNDLVLRVDVLWTLCEAEAEQKGIDRVNFAAGMVGDGLFNATEAMLDAIENFFPRDLREYWRALIGQTKLMRAKVLEAAIRKLNDPKLLDKLQKALDSRMDSELDGVVTQLQQRMKSPDSSESARTG